MLNIVVYLTHEGYILDALPPTIPQYKMGREDPTTDLWSVWELNSKGGYELQDHHLDYAEALKVCCERAHNINRRQYKRNWKGGSASLDMTCPYFAADGTPTLTASMIVWYIELKANHTAVVYYQSEKDQLFPVYTDTLSGCHMFIKDPKAAVEQRLVEQYRMHFGLGLYRYVTDLRENQTCEFVLGEPLVDVVARVLNLSSGWVARAYRVGSRFIERGGRFSTLISNKFDYDWNVTQLNALARLEDGEIAFLIDRALINPVMPSDEVTNVVRDYLNDPEHRLHREYLKTLD